MADSIRVMTENPLNAETQVEHLRSWITPNRVFFSRNQSRIMTEAVNIDDWRLTIDGEVQKPITFTLQEILRMPKVVAANTFECSGNGRSLLDKPAKGNPWTIGGVGNAVWGGIWLRELLEDAGPTDKARHVAFEGFDKSGRSAGIDFVRSIPIEKAMSTTLLAYEMNGEALPPAHGYPLRGLPLGWTGANCVKWLSRITVMDHPFEGYFMDKVYRVFQEGQQPTDGDAVTSIPLKSIIVQPANGEEVTRGQVVILGAAYGGDDEVAGVEVSFDRGESWRAA
ncbi:MAG TPA: molybdopterin-dependent oxidoreductase, partial [Spirochaetia bacterium]|nr:molybdopterin-dependent oxidoreductase [Spirochaetia bacterium]